MAFARGENRIEKTKSKQRGSALRGDLPYDTSFFTKNFREMEDPISALKIELFELPRKTQIVQTFYFQKGFHSSTAFFLIKLISEYP